MTTYDKAFYDYINKGSTSSAATIIPLILNYFPIKTVIDFGCGQGAWLKEWKRLGAQEILGLDGDYVDKEALLIDKSELRTHDLSKPVDVNKKFDLVQSLEVAEHLPEVAADNFVESLVKHGDVILFSASPIGQGGHDHINEQPYEYWRDKFLKKDYVLIDSLRPAVKNNRLVEPWYRFNTFLFVKRDLLKTLPVELTQYCVDDTKAIFDISPLSYQLRKWVLRQLPAPVHSLLAQVKKYSVLFSRQLKLPI